MSFQKVIEKGVDGIKTVDRWIASVEGVIALILCGVLVFGIFFQGFSRYVLQTNPPGITELAVNSLVWLGFLSASLATFRKRHLAVGLIPRLLSQKKIQAFLSILVGLGTFFLLLFLLRSAWIYLKSPSVLFRTTPFLQIPVKYVAFALLWGMGMMAFRFLLYTVEEILVLFSLYPEEKRTKEAGLLESIEFLRKKS